METSEGMKLPTAFGKLLDHEIGYKAINSAKKQCLTIKYERSNSTNENKLEGKPMQTFEDCTKMDAISLLEYTNHIFILHYACIKVNQN